MDDAEKLLRGIQRNWIARNGDDFMWEWLLGVRSRLFYADIVVVGSDFGQEIVPLSCSCCFVLEAICAIYLLWGFLLCRSRWCSFTHSNNSFVHHQRPTTDHSGKGSWVQPSWAEVQSTAKTVANIFTRAVHKLYCCCCSLNGCICGPVGWSHIVSSWTFI